MSTRDPTQMDAEEFLAYLQRLYAGEHGIALDDDGGIAIGEEDLQGVARRFDKELAEITPEGLNTVDYLQRALKGRIGLKSNESSLLKHAINTASLLVSRTERLILQKVPIGIVPHSILNAHCVMVPKGGTLIVFNLAMLGGSSIINTFIVDIFLSRYPFEDMGVFTHDVLDFLLLLRRLVLHDQKSMYVPRHLPPDMTLRAIEMAQVQRLFILLHEMGHAALGHLDSSSPKSVHPCSDPGNSVRYFTRLQHEEYEADYWAAQKINKLPLLASRVTLDQMRIALPFLFQTFHVMETLMADELADGRTHPPARDRLRRIAPVAFGVDSIREVREAGVIADMFSVVDMLTPLLSGLIAELRNRDT